MSTSEKKTKKRHSLLNNNNSFYLNVKKSFLEKNKNNINDNKIVIRIRNNSVKFRIRKYSINDIQEFMKKDKFKLRNDFDKNNVEKFLSSKEEAFEKTFCI